MKIKPLFLLLTITILFFSPLTAQSQDNIPAKDENPAKALIEFYYANQAFGIFLDTDDRKETFIEGDSLAFVFSSEQDAYFLLISIDSKGDIAVLYPCNKSEQEIIPANTTKRLANLGYVTGPNFGQEYVKAFAFKNKPDDYEQWSGKTWQADSDFLDHFIRAVRQESGYASQTTLSFQTCASGDYTSYVRKRSIQFNKGFDSKTITRGIIIMPYINVPVLFDYNKWSINSSGMEQARFLGNALCDPIFDTLSFLIIGHTDSRGSDNYNLILSEKRAESVKKFITDRFRIDPSRLIVKGMGEKELLYHGDTEEEHSLNRRVEIRKLEKVR